MMIYRVLYAEDNLQDADLTRRYFEKKAPEFSLQIVGTGKACLDIAKTAPFDVILLDHQLPDMDGLDLHSALQEAGVRVPVVLVTGSGDEDLVVRALRIGVLNYIPKTGDYLSALPECLMAAIHQYQSDNQRIQLPNPLHVLYAEHNEYDIDLTLHHIAEDAPHLVFDVVRSGAEVLQRCKSQSPVHIVLLDLRLPDYSALELLRIMKLDGRRLPVIVITGKGDEYSAVAALRLGAYDYIVKRQDYRVQLRSAIENAMTRYLLDEANRDFTRQLVDINENLEKKVSARTKELSMEVQRRIEIEEQLRQSHTELETRVAERTQELRLSNEKLQTLDRLRAEFIATMSHEFRTPLNVIIGFLWMVIQEVEGKIPKTVERHLALSYGSATHLMALVTDLLDLSQIEIGKMRLSEDAFTMESLVQRVVQELSGLASQKGIRLALEESQEQDSGVTLRNDERRVFQVLMNLVNNAIKFTDQGDVRVRIETTPDEVRVHVADTGIGISRQDRNKLFQPFQEIGETNRRKTEGTGLGLYLCQKILTLLGGRIWVDSVPGKGSTFSFSIPRRVERSVP